MQVYSAQFAPGDARVVTASEDKTAIIWDVTTGKPLGRPLVHDGEVYRAEFSPDGLLVTTASWDSTARIWDARSSTQVTPPLKHNGLLYSASFSPDGLKVITASEDHTARIWDAHTGLLINHMRHDSEVRIAQFSSDGLKILTASFDGLACVWDGLPGCSLPLRLKHEEPVRFAVFGPDGKSIAAVNSDFSSTVWRIEGSSPRAWKIPEENLPHGDTSGGRVFNGNEEICFSPDGTRVARISVSKTVRIYNWEARRELTPPLVHGERIKTLCFSPSGDRLLTGCMDGVTRMWNSSDGHLIWEKRLGSSGGVFSATFNRDGSQVLASSLDGTASICDATSGKKLVELSGHGYDKAGWKGWVLFAQFSPDGRKVVTASRDTTARVWDVVTGKETMSPLKHRATVSWAEFSPDSRKVLTASWDQTARLWDASTGKPLTAEIQHSGPIFSAKFSPDGTLLVTSSGDKTARVWDADTGRAISEPLSHGDEVAYAAFSQDGQKILTASSDRTVKIWDSPLAPVPVAPWLPDLAEAIAGQSFGPQGISKPVSLTNLFEIKRQLASRRLSGPFSDWARWFFGNRSTRAISPYCSTTMPSYIEQCIFEGTRDSLEEAIRLSPTNSIALAELIVHRNEFPKSPTTVTMKRLRNAAEGGDVRSMNELAWRQATDSDPQFRDGQSAVRFAEKAVAMTNRKDPAYLDTLAAAYAEACNFTNAIAVQREAMELLKEDILKIDFESRLKLYEANTPYHTAD
jgi:WD40 repeat protein